MSESNSTILDELANLGWQTRRIRRRRDGNLMLTLIKTYALLRI